ncbi:MAG: UvrD-helicase domain-containing protein, partial [Chitinivibrionales bacterium]
MPGTQRNYRDFDPYHVELKGKNLVEASAGTGKTYSIALMVTRMIAEGSVGDIRRILVVTFTNSATEELRQRIKRFITSLYEFLTQGIKDPDSVWRISSNIEDTKGASLNLKEALFRIDETPIYTIHSFSKKILTEFAFETGNMFESGIETSIEDLISRFCNTFWRQHIESIEPWILSELIGIRLNRNQIIRAAEKVLKGYRIDNRNTVSLHRAVKEYQALVKERESLEHGIEESFREERSAVTEFLTPKLRQEAEKGLAPLLDTLFKEDGSFNGTYIKKGREEGLNQFKFITDYRRVCRIESTMLPELMEKTAQGLCIKGAYFIKEEVTTLKRNLNIETFDDLINNLYSTLTRCRGRNMEQIRPITEKYSAVFIDEFQDTDYPQYEIFNTIFYEEHKTVFYIGDPKQSIYSWRGADIDLYNSVKEEIQDRVYTMDKNFRTSEPLIHAFNTLFSIIPPGSSTFFHDPRIEYKSVKPGNRERSIVSNSSTDPCGFLEYPLQIHVSETFKNDQITDYTALHIAKLISAGYRDENNNEINPGRIGVIVRTKDQGKAVKNSLRQHNIHAVTIDETSIFETPSAFDTLYLLHAVLMPSEANINRLLITGFFMIPGERLAGFTQGIDPASSGERDNYLEDLYNRLSDTLPDLRELWEREGVYVMIRRFLSDFQIKTRYTASEKTGLDKERRIADIIQLSEILSTAETRQSLTLSGLIEWHSRHIQGKEREEEEYRIRLEEDENAVQIVTIHKSKGLEYDFVFAPFMDLDETRPDEFIRDEQGQPETIRYTDKEGDKERYINSNREENRRLIYVAATRAVYGCSIFSNRRKGVMKKSSLAGVITEIIDKEYK